MNRKAKLPIGIENFEKIRTMGFYYVDKTALIQELLDNWGEVNLFTRPRRFGKSLNMSMLKYFFEYGCDRSLFDGLKIADEQDLCAEYMGNFPVISITLKGTVAGDYEGALAMLKSIVGEEALRFRFLLESQRLSDEEKARYAQLIHVDTSGQQGFVMSEDVLAGSLKVLSGLLCKHYGQKVVLLIDEYDVPLDKAQQCGFYSQMVTLVRNLFGQALKSNDSLFFAVLTGCLRIAHESIFTGLNNLQAFSVTNVPFDEHFGFTDNEVRDMLEYYCCGNRYALVKEWYDGYRFGNAEIYCPWDVISYCAALRMDSQALPRAYWLNTSGNDIIRNFIQKAEPNTRREIERLIDGESIEKKINPELTYRDLYRNMENLWSVLFATGYLTYRSYKETETESARQADDIYSLAIPNLEIRKIFIDQVMDWFQEEARKDTPKLDAFCDAFARADAVKAEELFNAYLRKTISIRDTNVRKDRKENFYHGILLGLLSHREDWIINSNAESGNGFSDILVELEHEGIGIVVEVKYCEKENLDQSCAEALAQIDRLGYEDKLLQEGMNTIYKYGIACYKKKCKVQLCAD